MTNANSHETSASEPTYTNPSGVSPPDLKTGGREGGGGERDADGEKADRATEGLVFSRCGILDQPLIDRNEAEREKVNSHKSTDEQNLSISNNQHNYGDFQQTTRETADNRCRLSMEHAKNV